MDTLPKPLLKRLALTILVGTSCFLIGLALNFYKKDLVCLILSFLLLLFSIINTITLYFQFKKGDYIILVGTCTNIIPKLFTRYYEIILINISGETYTILIDKSYKIKAGQSYRIYIKKVIQPNLSLKLEKTLLANNILAVETI